VESAVRKIGRVAEDGGGRTIMNAWKSFQSGTRDGIHIAIRSTTNDSSMAKGGAEMVVGRAVVFAGVVARWAE